MIAERTVVLGNADVTLKVRAASWPTYEWRKDDFDRVDHRRQGAVDLYRSTKYGKEYIDGLSQHTVTDPIRIGDK